MKVDYLKHDFRCEHRIDNKAEQSKYTLHAHDHHEIILLMNGDCDFQVEGNIYKLNHCDIVIASASEMHRIIPHSMPYERYVLDISSEFFAKNNLSKYSTIFQRQRAGVANYIPWERVRRSGVIDAISRVNWFYKRGIMDVATGCMYEVLYLLEANTVNKSAEVIGSPPVQKVLAYINDHLTEDLSLSAIAKKLNMSSTHICRIFKNHMRMTVQQYVTYKRLILAQSLYRNGRSMLEASMEAGFITYSSFYRMYMKEFNTPPGKDLREEHKKK